jgi:hypothetical protein
VSKRASVSSNNIEVKPRKERDFYPTPEKAVVPVVPHLLSEGPKYFLEPCAGNGALIQHIESLTDYEVICKKAYDIDPQPTTYSKSILQRNALSLTVNDVLGIDYIITNPPFQWDMLQPLLDYLPDLRPTWLLLPFGYACNKRMAPYMEKCKKLVPIGRVKWIEGSKQTSTDDYGWYLFTHETTTTKLYARQ